MPFYIITVVANVDEAGKPLLSPENGRQDVRQINVWDERDHVQLKASYRNDQSLQVMRLGHQHSPGRPLEKRGTATIFAPFLISIEDDVKHNLKQPDGPAEFLQRRTE